MNQNAEVFGAILKAVFTPPPWWLIVLVLGGQLSVVGLAIYGTLHLLGVA